MLKCLLPSQQRKLLSRLSPTRSLARWLPEEEEVDDGDYIPSDADSEDSLEWSSETERTMAEDALAEGTVGLDFYNAAVSVATKYVASYAPVQMGLKVATVVP